MAGVTPSREGVGDSWSALDGRVFQEPQGYHARELERSRRIGLLVRVRHDASAQREILDVPCDRAETVHAHQLPDVVRGLHSGDRASRIVARTGHARSVHASGSRE